MNKGLIGHQHGHKQWMKGGADAIDKTSELSWREPN